MYKNIFFMLDVFMLYYFSSSNMNVFKTLYYFSSSNMNVFNIINRNSLIIYTKVINITSKSSSFDIVY